MPRPRLRAADEQSREEYQRSTQHHLQHGGNQGSVHVAVADIADRGQFNDHDEQGYNQGKPEIADEKRKRVADPSRGGHQAAYQSSNPGMPSPCKGAIVR